jgi:hypothetical protein
MTSLSKNSCGNFEDYRAQCAYIQAINDVLDKCEEIERDRYGDPLDRKDEESVG